MTILKRLPATLGMAAALSMAATPAAAADLQMLAQVNDNQPEITAWNADQSVDRHRYRRYRRHRGVDAGDVIAGVVILGGIAAIASAASRNDRDRRYRDRDYRYRDSRYRDRDTRYRDTRQDRRYDSRGLDGAVDMCMREIERDVRVNTVDNVSRTASGWVVTGALYNGDGFTCTIGQDGRIQSVDYGARTFSQATDRQHDDATYAAAWNRAGAPQPGTTAAAPSATAQSAYPGGPIDGDLPEYPGDDPRNSGAEAGG